MSGLVAGMHCITLHGAWAHGVLHHNKPIENRSGKPWDKLIGKRIAIHAGANVGASGSKPATRRALIALGTACFNADGVGLEWLTRPPRTLTPDGLWHPIVTSAIVATALLVKCEENKGQKPPPWADPASKYWWHLADVEALAVPIPAIGKQGFWELAA